jgi:hypothetical protein
MIVLEINFVIIKKEGRKKRRGKGRRRRKT